MEHNNKMYRKGNKNRGLGNADFSSEGSDDPMTTDAYGAAPDVEPEPKRGKLVALRKKGAPSVASRKK